MQPSQPTPGVALPSNGPALPSFQAQKPMSMDELAKQTWKATDLVRVKNIDDEEFSWDAANAQNDTVVQPDKVTYEVYRSAPEHYTLEAGGSNVYFGYAAYIMVDQLYRKVLLKKGDGRMISNPDTQEEYLDLIFDGVVNPLDLARGQASTKAQVASDVANDLNLDASTKPQAKKA